MTWPTWRWLDANALLIRATAFVALLSIPFKHLPHRVAGVEHIVPVQLAATSHLVSFGLGLGLLYIASQVTMRKRNAWYVAVFLLTGLIIAELLHFRNVLQITLYAATLATIIKDRGQFVVKSDAVSFRRGLLTAAGLLAVVILFAGLVFELIDQRAYGKDLSTGQTISVTYQALVHDNLPADARMRRYDHRLLSMLRVSGVACAVIIGWSLFRPLRLRRRAPAGQRAEAQRLLEMYGNSSEDFFKIWPADKHFFFYEQAFVAYGVAGNAALVLDGASGDVRVFGGLRRQFLEFARLNGWTVAIVHADPAEADAWQQAGLNRIFIGSEAVVSCQEFAETTVRSKHFRYITNKAAKEGLRFSIWQPPLSQKQLHALRHISDAWLGQGGRREYSFMMGYFDEAYVGKCQIAVLERTDDTTGHEPEVVAYANLIPTFRKELASIDHMRFVPGLSSVSMHYLLRELMIWLHSSGTKTCNLGLAPLSKLQEQLDKTNSERLLLTIKRLGSRYYSFEGLEQFKGKFEPEWEPRYLLYQGSPARLVTAATALNTLSAYRPQRDKRRPWILAIAILAGLTYSSFPLALWLNRPMLWRGLVSDLGELGQPFAWVFNGLDVVSASLAVILAAGLLYYYRASLSRHRFLHWAVIALLISNIGALIAALVVLPAGFSLEQASAGGLLQTAVVVHGLSSFANSVGFVAAALLWGVQHHRRHQAHAVFSLGNWRLVAALTILAVSTLGAAVGYLLPDSSSFIQRFFIVGYMIWIIAFAADLAQSE